MVEFPFRSPLARDIFRSLPTELLRASGAQGALTEFGLGNYATLKAECEQLNNMLLLRDGSAELQNKFEAAAVALSGSLDSYLSGRSEATWNPADDSVNDIKSATESVLAVINEIANFPDFFDEFDIVGQAIAIQDLSLFYLEAAAVEIEQRERGGGDELDAMLLHTEIRHDPSEETSAEAVLHQLWTRTTRSPGAQRLAGQFGRTAPRFGRYRDRPSAGSHRNVGNDGTEERGDEQGTEQDSEAGVEDDTQAAREMDAETGGRVEGESHGR
jgi:hypothetical protein